jgi:hypothetical protein
MKTILTTALLAGLMMTSQTSARVGETLAQINARFGEPKFTSEARPPATLANVYHKAGLMIIIHFRNDISELEVYGKMDKSALTDAEQDALREANSGGKKWTKVAQISLSPEWKTEDGALRACYVPFEHYIAVMSADFVTKANEIQAQKEKAALGGF